MLSKNAIYLLEKRYCKSGESPEDVFKRVALALSLGDEKFEEKLFNLMINGIFLPNSPTLFNAPKGNLQACFILPIEDNMTSIFKTINDMAMIFKGGGGVGINFSPLREKNSLLSNGGTSSGVISFMKIFDNIVDTVKQGGKRRGALMGILNQDHPEIFNFITAKLEGKLQNFNLSVLVTDEFMKNVDNPKKTIDIISPKDGSKIGKVRVKDIFEILCFSAWVNGDPALLFYDRINKDNPLYDNGKGIKIMACNPCQPKNSLLLDGEFLKRIDSKNTNSWFSWKTGTKEVLELTFNSGLKTRFTSNHKIMLKNGEWCETKDSLNKEIKWGIGDRKYSFIDEKIVVDGFLFGDGYLSGGKYGVSTKLNSEKEFEVHNELIKYGFHKEKSGAYYKNLDNDKNLDFLNHRTFNRDLPDWVLFGDSNISASFIRGLFEANGSVNKHSQISLKATNLKMVEDIQIILASFGISSWIVPFQSKPTKWKNGTFLSKKSYNLQIAPRNSWKFKEKIGFLSNRKNNKIRKFNGEYKSNLKVTSIKSLGEMEVWDYTMNSGPHYNFCQGIIASNCSELAMPSYSACCLGSINLSKFIWKDKFNFDKFYNVCKIGCKALSVINSISEYPIKEIEETMKRYNPIGLGIMGFSDMLIKLGIYYDSQECLDIIDKIGEVYKKATDEYDSDKFYFYKRVIAPSGSLSLLADCSSGVEPIFDNVFERHLTIGKIEETRDIYDSPYIRTAHQVSPEWHVKVLAQWQKWIDGGCAKTCNLSNDATVDDIKEIFKLAWSLGTKGITVYRDGCRDQQVLYSKPKIEIKKSGVKCSDEECIL